MDEFHSKKQQGFSLTAMKVNIQSKQPHYQYQFSVADTGIVGVYGHSGSGKTSLLRALAGFQQSVTGTIKRNNKYQLNTHIKLNSHVLKCSYMSQNPVLFPHWDVSSNLKFAEHYSENKKDNIQEYLQALDCSSLMNKYPHQLSGGEKQRIAFIRALIQNGNNSLMLLDEPYSALDKNMRKKALEILGDYKSNTLIFLVTHDINELYYFADELLYIDKGTIAFQGSINKAMSSGCHDMPLASRITLANSHSGADLIDATDVSISLEKNKNSSIIHQIPVIISSIEIKGTWVVMQLITQNKQELFAIITTQSLHLLKLCVNMPVIANVKATSFK